MKIDRLVSIIMILLEKKRISAKELANTFEVSLRTIYRDIDAINAAGIPINCISGVGGGIEIMSNYKIDKSFFSANDLSVLLMGLSSMSKIIQGNEIVNALSKVKRFIPPEKAHDIEVKSSQIHIDFSSWFGNKKIENNLQIINTALNENRFIKIEYINHHGKRNIRIVEPYQLVLKSNNWYLYAYCKLKKDYRLFKLSRIIKLKLEEKTFLPKDFPKPQLDASEISKPSEIQIKLKIHKSILERMLDYCPFENFIPDGKDYYIVTFPFIENDFFYDFLLGFGNKCECISPQKVRNELKKRISDMHKIYLNVSPSF